MTSARMGTPGPTDLSHYAIFGQSGLRQELFVAKNLPLLIDSALHSNYSAPRLHLGVANRFADRGPIEGLLISNVSDVDLYRG